MAYTSNQQAIYDWVRASLPRLLFQSPEAAEEIWGAIVMALDRVRAQAEEWWELSYILGADSIWLNQHGKDRGLYRQSTESDAIFAERIRFPQDALTIPFLFSQVQAILAAAGVVGTPGMFPLRPNRAFLGAYDSLEGTGDSFAKSGNVITLTDAATTFQGWEVGKPVTISGATSGGNNGTFTITSLDTTSHKLIYTNASGVAEAFGGTWKIHSNRDGRQRAYVNRGYRCGNRTPAYLVTILPYGTTEATRLAVLDMLQNKAAAGVVHLVERRLNP